MLCEIFCIGWRIIAVDELRKLCGFEVMTSVILKWRCFQQVLVIVSRDRNFSSVSIASSKCW